MTGRNRLRCRSSSFDRFARPPFGRRASRILLAVFMAAAIAGCGGTRWRRENIFASKGLYLYREWKVKEGEPVPLGYRHPIEVSPEKLAVLLSKIVYRKDSLFDSPEDAFVFEPEQVEVGALTMSTALEAISPDERLRFLFVKSSLASLLTGIKGTSGVLFSTRKGMLELAFDRVHAGMAGADQSDPTRFSFPYDPTEYDNLSPLRVDDFGVTRHVDPVSELEYPRWLEVELAAIEVPRRQRAPKAPVAGRAANAAEESTGDAANAAATTKDTADAERGAATQRAPADAPVTDDPPAKRDADYEKLKESLDLLERLRGDGVISEEEFAERRKRLLDQALGETE